MSNAAAGVRLFVQRNALLAFTPTCQRESIHTTRRRPVHPLLWALLRPVGHVSAFLAGRTLRRNRQIILPALRRYAFPLAVTGGSLSLAYVASHLERAPVTGRIRLVLFTPAQLDAVVDYEHEMMVAELKTLPESHAAYGLVWPHLQRLLSAADSSKLPDPRPDVDWRLTIVDSNEVNAMVLPNKTVFVNVGLLRFCRSENELAMVLAHELSHAYLRHGSEKMSRMQFTDYLVILTMTAIWCFIPFTGVAAITHWFLAQASRLLTELPYDRFFELEADVLGSELGARACYDVRTGPDFYRRMETIAEEPPVWLSTHPSNGERARRLDEDLSRVLRIMATCNCPPLP